MKAISNAFFCFDSFDDEIAKKIRSLNMPANVLMDLLIAHLHDCKEAPTDLDRKLRLLFTRLSSFSFDHTYAGYLTHPIRVAASFSLVLDNASYDLISLALCHNIIECGIWEKFDPEGLLLSGKAKESIQLLSIDRSKEKDGKYLSEYYQRIENFSDELLLLKALDKMDNVLWWQSFDVERYQAECILNEVCPRIAPKFPRVESYLRALVAHVWHRTPLMSE